VSARRADSAEERAAEAERQLKTARNRINDLTSQVDSLSITLRLE